MNRLPETMPLSITAVLPACNNGKTIQATLESVLSQTQPPEDIVVVDDASTDDTCDCVRKFGDQVRLVERNRNSGSADIPRYQGVEAATTEWVALLDADDLWLPTKMEKMTQAIERYPEIPLWHHAVRVIDANGHCTRIRHEGTIPATGNIGPALLERCFICTSSVIVRRDLWLKARALESLKGYGTEWDFFLSIAREHPVGFVDDVLGCYRYTTTSISRKNWKRYSRDVVGMHRIYKNGLWQGLVTRSKMKSILVAACREDADLHRYDQHPRRSLWFCMQGLKYRPWDSGLWMRTAKGLGRIVAHG